MRAYKAIYDGKNIQLKGKTKFPKNSKLIVILLDDEPEEWYVLSSQSLDRAYSEQEPEYTLSAVKDPNPGYEGR